MQDDAQKIRELIADWQRATAAEDLPQVLAMMAEDAVFLLPGQPPMRGRDAFAAAIRPAFDRFHIESTSNIHEIQVAGDWAWCWNQLKVTMSPKSTGAPIRRSGYTLTVFRRNPDGRWVLFRDANLVTVEAPAQAQGRMESRL